MNSIDDAQEIPAFIRELMPNAGREEILEAADNVRRYIAVVVLIQQRVELSKKASRASPTDKSS